MSLIPAKSLAVALCADSVGVVLRQGRADQKRECIEVTAGEGPVWRGAVESLMHWLAGNPPGRAQVSVVLSSRFVRYALAPWPPTALKRNEGLVWARVHLEAAYGDMSGWTVACDAGEYGGARVACAVREDLLHALRETLASGRLSVGSITPAFVCGWNRWRRRVQPGQFFGMAESDRFVLGCLGQRGWESLRVLSAQVTCDELIALTRREHALLGRVDAPRTMLHVPGLAQSPSVQGEGGDFHWASLDAGETSTALAMARLVAAT